MNIERARELDKETKSWQCDDYHHSDYRIGRIRGFLEGWKQRGQADADIVCREPELPGEMPDEMWLRINGDRKLTTISHQMSIKQTKENILGEILKLSEGDTTGEGK